MAVAAAPYYSLPTAIHLTQSCRINHLKSITHVKLGEGNEGAEVGGQFADWIPAEIEVLQLLHVDYRLGDDGDEIACGVSAPLDIARHSHVQEFHSGQKPETGW